MIFEVVFLIKETTQSDVLNGCNGPLCALDAHALKFVSSQKQSVKARQIGRSKQMRPAPCRNLPESNNLLCSICDVPRVSDYARSIANIIRKTGIDNAINYCYFPEAP